ncbi:neprilysin [Drosophila grimshawi]|uniref:GH24757 n=1 Tax=Drosophila grimshawi TaxID=7222 RepID=B4JN64_DROGR|nr:neprilysin [Drosophila grimshawi]EDV92157.1 GH24757 [Drosophila grimshawi]
MCKLQLLLLMRLVLAILASDGWPGYLQLHMNASADPCLDFYEHACGGWEEAHVTDAYSSQLEQLDHVYHEQLASLLEQITGAPSDGQPRFVELLRSSYAACRDQQAGYDAAQFVRWLRDLSGISMTSEDNDNWSQVVSLLKGYGVAALQQFEMEMQPESRSDAELWLLQLQLPWPHSQAAATRNNCSLSLLTRSRFRQLYRELQPLGVPEGKLWQQIKQLEKQLRLLWLLLHPSVVLDDASGVEVDLTRWLLPLPATTESVEYLGETYLRGVSLLLAAQPPSLVARYLQLRLLHQLELQPVPPLAFGRQQCAAQSRQLLTHAVVWLMQEAQLPQLQRQQMRHSVQQLFAKLRRQFELKLLANRNQFDAATQRFLLDKLRRMQLRVGVLPPTGTANEHRLQLETHYAALQLNASDYYGNLRALLQLIDNDRQKVATADLYFLQPDGFGSYASPFFLPGRNVVLLPHSLFGGHLYWPDQAAIYRYSGLGFLIAHELSHGFAPSDVHYDGCGNEANAQQQQRLLTNRHFGKEMRCLRRRHGQMADEKFADINGIALAYDSYFAGHPASTAAKQQQLFFLNFAQFFCQDEQQLEEDVEDSNQHGDSRQRVNDAVASSESFALAFSCDRQKEMKRRRICQLY